MTKEPCETSKTPTAGIQPVGSGVGLGVSPTHDVRKAVEDVLIRATKEAQIRGKWVYYGSLGRINVYEARAHGVSSNIRPGWRRFTENKLISMRISMLEIVRKMIEAEAILKRMRAQLPSEAYRELVLAVSKAKFEALITLKDIDERLFDIKYAVYDVV
jgi:hypothetical protein